MMANEQLLQLIDNCIVLCQNEKDSGYSGEATEEQIEHYILPELYELREKVICNNLPYDRYLLAFGYAFRVWEWHTESTSRLFLALQSLHNVYKNSNRII